MDNCRAQPQGSAAREEVFGNGLRVGSWDRAEQKELHYWEAGTIENRNGPFPQRQTSSALGARDCCPTRLGPGKCVRALFVVL